MTKTFAILNQKGGVAKTTTVVNIAHAFAIKGYRTLIVDTDPQGNVADDLGLSPGNELRMLLTQENFGILKVQDNICRTGRKNLDVVRSDEKTALLKIEMGGLDFRIEMLDRLLTDCGYDLIFIDCPPSIDVLMTASVYASDYLIIPTRLDENSVKGVRQMQRALKPIQERSTCELGLVVPTFYDRTTNESIFQMEQLLKDFPQYLTAPIPHDTLCREASREGKTIWEYAPNSRASIGYPDGKMQYRGGYANLVAEIENRFITGR